MTKPPLVSIIITARDSEKFINNCLRSVRNQRYKNIETIVVDNGSTDRTKKIAHRYTNNVFNYGPERSAQRNYGAKKGKGKYLLYLDSDMVLHKNVVQEAVEKMEKAGLAGLYIPEVIMGTSFFSKVRNFERSFYNTTVIDAVRFIRKDIFIKVGGFDEGLTGPEDWDLDKRIRNCGRIGIINSPLYHDEREFVVSRYLDKKSYYIKDLHQYIKKWGKDDPVIKKQLGPGYRLWGVFLENGKWKKLACHPLLALGMFLLRISVGFKYIIAKSKNTP
jgi:glycosyltransferase involved in cell wall biosynthesis